MNSKYKFLIIILVALAVLLVALVAIFYGIYLASDQNCIGHELKYSKSKSSPLGNYSRLAVSVDDKTCAKVGKDILVKGGSAVDAAIATGLCNSLFNAHSMGIGGGHYMVIYLRSRNKSYMIDARETAPINSHENMFVDNKDKSIYGGLATGIPGEVYGYWKAHQLAGKLPWSELFEPTIRLSQEGHAVSNTLGFMLNKEAKQVARDKGLSDMFVNPSTRKVYARNDVIKREKYAQTLRLISKYGYQAFYNGPLTRLMIDEINKNGGNVTIEDFKRYQPRVFENRFAIRLDDDFRLFTTAPPSSGVLVAYILKIMKKFHIQKEKLMSTRERIVFYHRLFEAIKHAYAMRDSLGDEYFVDLNKFYQQVLNDKDISEVAKKIESNRTFPSSFYGSVSNNKNEIGTAHISVIDPNGDAVALTSSINNWFGARYAGTRTGIIYNNVMNDFSTPGFVNTYGLAPSRVNMIAPGKRPVSSMTPVIIVDRQNRTRFVMGASGGARIISTIAQVALRVLWMGEDIKSAIEARRIHHQLSPDYAWFEEDFSDSVEKGLKKLGHTTKCFAFGYSSVQAIQVKRDRILAYADPRKGDFTDGQ